jgi:hypothetical protein
MPFEYERDDARRLVVIRMTATFSLADVLSVVDRHHAENLCGYGMVYDLTEWVGLPTEIAVQQPADYVWRSVGIRAQARDCSSSFPFLPPRTAVGGVGNAFSRPRWARRSVGLTVQVSRSLATTS